jgi:23S rRNA (cytosine1962-C5)-methyltransferase
LAAAHARRVSIARESNCYRLHDADADAIPGVTVERYGDFAVLHAYTPAAEGAAHELGTALLAMGASGVYLKVRRRGDTRKLLAKLPQAELPLVGAAAPPELEVNEQGRRYLVRLGDGIATGLFLDQRDNRARLQLASTGQRVLNLFCYTGSFSVAAGLGGAREVVSVDSSRAALSRLDANLRLNALEPARHRLLRADVPNWLERAARRGERFDYVVLDPPTYSGRAQRAFTSEQQYRALVASCLGLCSPGACLLCVTNHRGTTKQALERTLVLAASDAGRQLDDLTRLPPPLDCPAGASGEAATKSVLLLVR